MNNLLFSIENISLMSTIMINFILIIIVSLIKNKTKNNYFFIGFISSIFLWTVSTFVFLISPLSLSSLPAKLFYISGCIIPVFIILFTSTFPQQNLNFKTEINWIYVQSKMEILIEFGNKTIFGNSKKRHVKFYK